MYDDETENNITEEIFSNNVFNGVEKVPKCFLKLGEDIGESSTDDIFEDGLDSKMKFPSVKLLASRFLN